MSDTAKSSWKDRLRASGIHLCISVVIAGLAALLVFALWYPGAYQEISGGRDLFLILVSVDVVLGPLITLTIFNRAKPMRELRRDLAIVGLLQLVALGYGMWTVFVARPVHLVFEYKLFRVVHAADIPEQMLAQAPKGIDPLPLTGPTVLALRPFRGPDEQFNATMTAVNGLSLSAQPGLWQPYADARARILEESRSVRSLKRRFPEHAAEIDRAIARTGRQPEAVAYVPLAARKTFWTVLVDSSSAEVVGFIPLDSF